jgi:hypothetical protein
MWQSEDPNIQFMLKEYSKLVAEQEETKRTGFRLNDYCYNCKKFQKKLKYKLCANGYISYWCDACY